MGMETSAKLMLPFQIALIRMVSSRTDYNCNSSIGLQVQRDCFNVAYNPVVDRCFIIHYNELGLKKGNRDYFENRLCANINSVLQDCQVERAKRISGRILLPLNANSDVSQIKKRLGQVFGIAYFGEAWASPQVVENLE